MKKVFIKDNEFLRLEGSMRINYYLNIKYHGQPGQSFYKWFSILMDSKSLAILYRMFFLVNASAIFDVFETIRRNETISSDKIQGYGIELMLHEKMFLMHKTLQICLCVIYLYFRW